MKEARFWRLRSAPALAHLAQKGIKEQILKQKKEEKKGGGGLIKKLTTSTVQG